MINEAVDSRRSPPVIISFKHPDLDAEVQAFCETFGFVRGDIAGIALVRTDDDVHAVVMIVDDRTGTRA